MKTRPEELTSEQKTENGECFVIMPISDPDGYDDGHFLKVYEDVIKVAIIKAGYTPIRASDIKQTNHIHIDILNRLIESPMAVCDLSTHNPNVLFELGLRQAFDKPTVLIQECGTKQIFDIAALRYTEYDKELKYREVLSAQEAIRVSIIATKSATEKSEGVNSLIKLLAISKPAKVAEYKEGGETMYLQVLMAEMQEIKNNINQVLRKDLPTRSGISLSNKRMGVEKLRLRANEALSALERNDAPEKIKYLLRLVEEDRSSINYEMLPNELKQELKMIDTMIWDINTEMRIRENLIDKR